METNNKNYKIFKILGLAVVLFYAFIFIGSSFSTTGVKDAKPIEYKSDYLNQKMELRDAEILGKFWNDKGHFIVVYDEDTKAPELFQIDFSEWNLISVGDTY
jgi:hypothetical protein|nr:MAG TPA: hypothetical protein [Caudoviricetes sp.]